MREIRPSGLEAGGTGNRFSLCLSSAGWRRRPSFGVCDLPKGPGFGGLRRREYTHLRHALLRLQPR